MQLVDKYILVCICMQFSSSSDVKVLLDLFSKIQKIFLFSVFQLISENIKKLVNIAFFFFAFLNKLLFIYKGYVFV